MVSTRDKILAIKAEFDLAFNFNPGGGIFFNDVLGECKVPAYNTDEDYEKLVTWLKAKADDPKLTPKMRRRIAAYFGLGTGC